MRTLNMPLEHTAILSGCSYEELIQLVQAGEITYLDFISAQSELSERFAEYLKDSGSTPAQEKDAISFLEKIEKEFINNQEVS